MQFYKYFSQYSGFTFSHILFEYHINKGYSTKSAKKKSSSFLYVPTRERREQIRQFALYLDFTVNKRYYYY